MVILSINKTLLFNMTDIPTLLRKSHTYILYNRFSILYIIVKTRWLISYCLYVSTHFKYYLITPINKPYQKPFHVCLVAIHYSKSTTSLFTVDSVRILFQLVQSTDHNLYHTKNDLSLWYVYCIIIFHHTSVIHLNQTQ